MKQGGLSIFSSLHFIYGAGVPMVGTVSGAPVWA